jgi:ATP-dependent Clp protease ATP-binding subunit ClpC
MEIDLKTLQSAVAFVIGDSGYPVIGEIKLAARTELVLKCAIDIADTFNQQYVDTEHLLLALAQEDKGVVASVLKRLGIDRQRLRERAFQIVELSSK